MYVEPIPLYIFIKQSFEYKEIKSVTDQWRVETQQLINIILAQINELGIYEVNPGMEVYMRKILLEFLRTSPEIIKMVHEAERRERILARTKKSLSD